MATPYAIDGPVLVGRTSGDTTIGNNTGNVAISRLQSFGVVAGSDATGDTWYRDGSGHVARLAIGTTGMVLSSDGTSPMWVAQSGAVSGFYNNDGSQTTIADNTWTPITSWVATTAPYFTNGVFDEPSGTLTSASATSTKMWIEAAIAWDNAHPGGSREVRFTIVDADGGGPSTPVTTYVTVQGQPGPNGSYTYTQDISAFPALGTDDTITVEVRQTSGTTGAVLANSYLKFFNF
jgi:hypothetical protein